MAEVDVEMRQWDMHANPPRLLKSPRANDATYEVLIWATNVDPASESLGSDHWLAHLKWDRNKEPPSKLERRRAVRQVFELLRTRYDIKGKLTWQNRNTPIMAPKTPRNA